MLTYQWKSFESAGEAPFQSDRAVALQKHVDELLVKNAIERVHNVESLGYYSTLFLVPKKNRKMRPVINLRDLNEQILIPDFHMETPASVSAAVQQGDWATSIDLADAFFHIPIAPSFRKYLRFVVRGIVYQYKALPFGLSTAPLVFTKILAPVAAFLHFQGIVMHVYLDDLLIRCQDRATCGKWTMMVLHLLFYLGLGAQLEKSDLNPSQVFTYIGIRFLTDVGLMVPPQDRLDKIETTGKSLIKEKGGAARLWLSLIGLMGSAERQVPRGRLRIRPIQHCLRAQFLIHIHELSDLVYMNTPARKAIEWWLSRENTLAGQPLGPFTPDIVLVTDASLDAWGAHAHHFQARGTWTQEESTWSINALELLAIVRALQRAPTNWTGQKMMVVTDNTTAVAYLNHQGGTRSRKLMDITSQIFQLLEDGNMTVRSRHIPGRLNKIADLLSRPSQVISTEWTLHPDIFQQVCRVWGTPEVDLMATYMNAQLPVYVSPAPDPEASGEESLSTEWSWQFLYCFPPWAQISATLLKLQSLHNKTMILIAPMWPSKPWFPLLLSLLLDHPRRLPLTRDLLRMPINKERYYNLESLHLHAWLISSDVQNPGGINGSQSKSYLNRITPRPLLD